MDLNYYIKVVCIETFHHHTKTLLSFGSRNSVTVGLGCTDRNSGCQEFDVDEVIEVDDSQFGRHRKSRIEKTNLAHQFVAFSR